MNDLLVIVPSRGRPENIERLVDAWQQTSLGRTTLLVGLDSDDPSLADYVCFLEARTEPWIEYAIRSDLRQVVPWLNELGPQSVDAYRFIGTIGDDNLPRTVGWDVEVIKSLWRQEKAHGVGFAFGDDQNPGRPRGSLCCHIFMTANVIERLGYMGPPELRHMYVDDVWMKWGQMTSMEFLPHVVIEHMHHELGKSKVDDTYRDSEAMYGRDRSAYMDYLHGRLTADIDKLKETAK